MDDIEGYDEDRFEGHMNNNNTFLNGTQSPLRGCASHYQSHSTYWIKVAVYLVTMAISLGGNSLVMCVVYRNIRLRTPTNYLIANMAISDLVMTAFTMTPTAAVFISRDYSWYNGWFAVLTCKLIIFIQGTSMACSIFTLTAIAWERFLAVVFPLRTTIRSGNTKVVVALVWVCACLVTSPILPVMTVQLHNGKPFCREVWSPPLDPIKSPFIFTIASFVILYILPLLIITVLYSTVVYKMWLRKIPGNSNQSTKRFEQKVRKNVIKMLITVVGVFAVFWLPLHLNMFLREVSDVFSRCGVPDGLSFTSYVLSHSTGAINFGIYVAFSEDYSQGFKRLCCPCWIRKILRMRAKPQSMRTEQMSLSRRNTRPWFPSSTLSDVKAESRNYRKKDEVEYSTSV